MDRAGQHKAMAHVLAGRTIIAGSEGIELSGMRSTLQRADAIHIIKKFAEQATPGCAFESCSSRPG